MAAKKPTKKVGRPRVRNKKRKVSFALSPETTKQIEAAAKAHGVSKSHIVERCLRCQLLGDCGKIP